MNKYKLTAVRGGTTRVIRFEAPHDERAIFEASFLVMERAYNNPIWAKGSIELTNKAGEVLAEMAAK